MPPFERLFLGGEQDLRGFDIRTVTPIAFIPIGDHHIVYVLRIQPTSILPAMPPAALTPAIPVLTFEPSFPGGDTSGVLNAEYRIPIVGPVSSSLFLDAGAVGALRQRSTAAQLNAVFPAITSLFPSSASAIR